MLIDIFLSPKPKPPFSFKVVLLQFFIHFSPLKCELWTVRINSLDFIVRIFGEKENVYHEVILFRPSLCTFIRLKHSQSLVLQHDLSVSLAFTVTGHASYRQRVKDRHFVYVIICIIHLKLFSNIMLEHLVGYTSSRTACTHRFVAFLRHRS